jgi:cyclopropane-fatty-acyl-phospholipid synthase
MDGARRVISDLFGIAGLTVNGDGSGDPKIHDERFYPRVLAQGSLGLGESYMDGWWDADPLDEFFTKLLRARLEQRLKPLRTLLPYLKAVLVNLQTLRKARAVVDAHYNLGNDFFADMLDRRLLYTCGYWDGARDLDEAQEKKCDLVCRKVGLKQGDRVLDLGCGWGGFAMFAAERYGASVTGFNISDAQVAYADEHSGDLPVQFACQDWREAGGVYEHVVAIGLLEHVGYRNYRRFMKHVSERLNDDGLFLLHSIGRDTSTVAVDPWIHRYSFPTVL